MMRWLSRTLLGLIVLLTSCGPIKAFPPCHESDGDVAYTQAGEKRIDGLFLTWQCYQRMQQDLHACYDEAK